MSQNVYVYDPSVTDELSRVRGIGRYIQILRENFPDWQFSSDVILGRNKVTTPESGQARLTNTTIFINPFINFLQRPLLTKRVAKKQIAVIHDLIPLKYPAHFPAGIKGSLNIFTNKLALKNYDLIVTDSEASKKDIIKILRIDEKNIQVIYPCLPDKFLNNELRIMNNGKGKNHNSEFKIHASNYCIYVGDVTWNKNLVNLAKAIKMAGVTCVFVGKAFQKSASNDSPWLREFNEFAKLTDGDKRFVFPGFVSDEELRGLYQNARVNLLISRDEGFGFSYLEGASQSSPSILSDISVFRETAQDSALFVDPENPREIEEKIKELFTDKTLRLDLGKKAKKRAEYFSVVNFKKEFQSLVSS